jgi:thioredoxin 1
MELNVNEGSFEKEVIKSEQPVLVDFWAAWCGPCMALGPVVSHVARHFAGRLKVCKVNVDEAKALAVKYGIQSIPTLILFEKGKIKDKIVGSVPQRQLEQYLKEQLGC